MAQDSLAFSLDHLLDRISGLKRQFQHHLNRRLLRFHGHRRSRLSHHRPDHHQRRGISARKGQVPKDAWRIRHLRQRYRPAYRPSARPESQLA